MTIPIDPRSGLRRFAPGFTLVEVLVSMALLIFLMLVLVGVTEAASRAWRSGQSRTEAFQSARTSLEIMARELAPAVVDTRMQFVVAPGSILTQAGAMNVAEQSPALLWMAPHGEDGSLHCVGYYLSRDDVRRFYRLQRIYIAPPTTVKLSPYFPRMVNQSDLRDKDLRTSPVDARWFTRAWDVNTFDEENAQNDAVVVSSAADGVIALWAQCLDVLGNPVPLLSKSSVHPASDLFFNSAAYFQVATSTAFDGGVSFQYLAASAQTMKANRVPSAIDLTIVTIDSRTLARGMTIPAQVNVYDSKGALDVDTSVRQFTALLQGVGVYTARTFSTRAKLVNGN